MVSTVAVGVIAKAHFNDRVPSNIHQISWFAAAGPGFTSSSKISVIHGSLHGAHARSNL
jgi:hypothetical protein